MDNIALGNLTHTRVTLFYTLAPCAHPTPGKKSLLAGESFEEHFSKMSNHQSEDATKITELSYREKVPVVAMKEIIHECLCEKLINQQYEGEKCNEAAKSLADLIRNRLKNLGYDRYKYIVQVLIGERREQGVYFGTRCFWDVNTDNQASDSFSNVGSRAFHLMSLHNILVLKDHIFCTATAFAIYLY